MPADSFECPLTLAACGGHVELAMLLLERSANIEEVNDEGYTPPHGGQQGGPRGDGRAPPVSGEFIMSDASAWAWNYGNPRF